MDNLETQNLSNIILQTNNNENNTYLKSFIPAGLPMNTTYIRFKCIRSEII